MSTRKDASPSWSILLPLLAALTLPSCKEEEVKEEKKAEEDLGPPVKVQLPPTPDFDEGKAPETYPDGSLSIYGLRKDIDQNVADGDAGKEVMVKGWVQEIYVAPECPEGEVCPPGKQPHVWITDGQGQEGKKRAMMVVNYKYVIPEFELPIWKDQPVVVLEKDKQYTFKGKFKRFSDSGFAFDSGLLEFVAYKPHDPETGQELDQWVIPPGAPWHPVAVQQTEEENAQLAEKAKASLDAKAGGGE